MTYRELLESICGYNSDNPEREAELLLECLFNISPVKQKLMKAENAELPNKIPAGKTAPAAVSLYEALERRSVGEPLQYIVGRWDFCNETYLLTPDCLIPRPDTELLVELASVLFPPGAVFADICTGSGCVAISTLAARPDTRAFAIDISAGALALAEKNAVMNGVAERVCFHRADIFSDTDISAISALPFPPGGLAAITANPPYIPSAEISALARELSYEPLIALDGGEDGLRFYRRLIRDFFKYIREDGFMLLEIGYNQADSVRSIAAESGLSCEIRRDAGGNCRTAIFRRGN